MKEKFDQFFNQWNGKFCEVNDPSNYAQCMDLAYAWCDALGVPRDCIRSYYAYQIWTQPKDIALTYFEFIPNTPNGLPQAGDIVVLSNKIGVAGHVCIATGNSNTNSFESFDQNWGTLKSCHLVTHNYDAVLGWLRYRVQTEPPLNADEERSLSVLRDAFKTLKVRGTNETFGNLEGMTRELVGYYQKPAETITVEVPVPQNPENKEQEMTTPSSFQNEAPQNASSEVAGTKIPRFLVQLWKSLSKLLGLWQK